MQNVTSHLIIENQADDSDIIFRSDDGQGGTTEYFRLDGSDATHNVALYTRWADNSRIALGTGSCLLYTSDAADE